jgi:hypothetical protein
MRCASLLLVAAAVALAGCTFPGSNPPTPTATSSTPPPTPTPSESTPTATPPAVTSTPPPPDSFVVALVGVPTVIEAGSPLNLTVNVSGTGPHGAQLVEVRFGASSTAQPSPSIYTGACAGPSGAQNLPGAFAVDGCTLTQTGTTYLRAHVVLADGQGTSLWSDEANVTVHAPVGNDSLSSPDATAAPSGGVNNVSVDAVLPAAHAGTAYTFHVNVTGSGQDAGTLDARYGQNASATPSAGAYEHACAGQAVAVPGSFTVTCEFTTSDVGNAYLRARLVVTIGSAVHEFWSPEYQLTVLPV